MELLEIALSSLYFLTLKEKILLRKNIDRIERLAVLSIEDISLIIGRSLGSRVSWDGNEVVRQSRRASSIMEGQGISACLYGDDDYPPLLKEIVNPPFCVYYRGDVRCLGKETVSVVGTRKPCRESAVATLEFAKAAAEDSVTVVSGNAIGIDSFAHRGALSSGKEASTAAVLPCGIDIIVPAGNKAMLSQVIRTGGVVLSEYIPGCPAEKWRFVQRNRLIAALSPATVVMQAPAGSGALITASFALDYNRDVMFHSSAFCEEAKKIDEVAAERLGSSGTGKVVRRCAMYVDSGAPVIDDYGEYKKALRDAPGSHSVCGDGQLDLLE
ncbi:MAG: DNA-processing protein DprA [Treponema sp.]|nr:DNA-processing protein DprA [Treponema sp.]